MRLELAHSIHETVDVLQHDRDLNLDETRLLTHANVAQYRTDCGQRRHHRGRRHEIDLQPVAQLHHVWMVGVDLGVHSLRWDEHQCAVGGLTRNDVLLRDVAEVLLGIGSELLGVSGALGRVVGIQHRHVCRQRELRIDHDGAGRIGEFDHAVGSPGVGQHHLKPVGARGKRIHHDVVELDLAERTASMLVVEDVLEGDDLLGEVGDGLLRLVDRLEPLGQLAQRLRRRLRRVGEVLAHRRFHGVQTFVDVPRQALLVLGHGVGERLGTRNLLL